MNSNKLPISIPPVIGLQFNAFPLAILLNYDECYPWFMNNYIQLQANKREVSFYRSTMFRKNPFIESVRVRRTSLVSKVKDLKENIIDSIDNNFYVLIRLNEYYIPGKTAYKNEYYTHRNMFYGYNRSKEVFYILGYDKSEKLGISELSFSEFDLAFENVDDKWIHYFRKRENEAYKFDIVLVEQLLQDYLNSQRTLEKNMRMRKIDVDAIYGIGLYLWLQQYFKDLKDNNVEYNIIPLHILWEHKKCMSLRIKYLLENGYIKDDFLEKECSTLESKALKLRNLQIKMQVSGNRDICTKIISRLKELEKEERIFIEKLLDEIDVKFA